MAEEKNPNGASNGFHSIMRASVSIKKFDKDTINKFKDAVKEKFGINLIINDRIVYPKGITASTVTKIQKYYQNGLRSISRKMPF